VTAYRASYSVGGENNGRNATNSTRATEETTGTATEQKGICLYRRGLRMASLLSTMVILLCDQFQHCPKHSGFHAVARRGWGDSDGIVGPVGHETGRLNGWALTES